MKAVGTICIFVSILMLVGCTETNTAKDYILGTWISQESIGQDETATFTFYENNSLLITVTLFMNESADDISEMNLWYSYKINEETLTMYLAEATEFVSYQFSDDYSVVTFTEKDSGTQTILQKLN